MAFSNPNLDSTATNERIIRNKMQFIMKTYLGEALEAYNTRHGLTGPEALEYPKTINYGVNTMDLSKGTDGFPAISIVPTTSQQDHNIYQASQDVIIDYDIVSAAVCDAADLNYNVEKARAYGAIVSALMEKHLSELPGRTNVSSVYNVEGVRTVAGRPTSIGQGLFLLSSVSVFRVYSRAAYDWDPAYVSADYEVKPSVESNYFFTGTAEWLINGTTTVSAERASMASISMGATDTLALRFVGSNVPTGSSVATVVRRDRSFTEIGALPFTDGNETITLTLSGTPQTGDVVNVIITVNGTNNELNYPARITII